MIERSIEMCDSSSVQLIDEEFYCSLEPKFPSAHWHGARVIKLCCNVIAYKGTESVLLSATA